MKINLYYLGIFFAAWIPAYWLVGLPLLRKVGASFAYYALAFLLQFVPVLGLTYLLILAYLSIRTSQKSQHTYPDSTA